jgi:hypothetical protein
MNVNKTLHKEVKMKKEEVLEKSSSAKCVVGEMEKHKINKGNYVALIVAGVFALVFMVIEGALRHFEAIFALAAVCYTWASIFYACQYFIAKRPCQVLIGAILEGLAAIASIVFFVLFSVGVLG